MCDEGVSVQSKLVAAHYSHCKFIWSANSMLTAASVLGRRSSKEAVVTGAM